jgi:hypothetical protein
VIGHNGAVPGYTTGMFLVPEKNMAIALMMNTYSPMLGILVSRVPSSVLRMLLGQEIIPGYEFPYMRIVYALVMLIPLMYIVDILTTPRRIHFLRTNTQISTQMQVTRYIGLPLIWNAAIAYILLVALPITFDAKMSVILLFQPDVGWVALISGIFAIAWGLLRTGIVISTLRHKS